MNQQTPSDLILLSTKAPYLTLHFHLKSLLMVWQNYTWAQAWESVDLGLLDLC